MLAKEELWATSIHQEILAAQDSFRGVRPMLLSERTSSLAIDALEFAFRRDARNENYPDQLLHTLQAFSWTRDKAWRSNTMRIDLPPMTGEHIEKF
jgi:hypothetical protein